ncbi:MAG: ABC transporter ATP-binding protein [Roseiflexaceae bacterium]|nr:ABC transporter ATP-binding protein [Roseiflexaceae bacterium]
MSEAIITISNVERTFQANGREVRALRGVDMAIPRGAFVVLMGPSGSGKTTLLNLVGGLDQPSQGSVLIEGRRTSQMSGEELAALRRRIGFIFQSFALIPTASVYENVELGLRIAGGVPRSEWATRIRRCVSAVGLLPWIDHRPYELSGGQQQRVAIARALAIRPQIILADEPTGDLDSKTGATVLSLLRELADHEDVTLLMATHDPAAAEYATDVYQLRDGVVAAHQALGR